ncbi:MAG: uroporphyrinogen-III synthase [Bacteroidota bacterium]
MSDRPWLSEWRPRVVLLRAPDPEPPDRYVHALQARGIRAVCAPVLRFDFINGERLGEALRAYSDYAAWIFTSPRAAEAVARVRPDFGPRAGVVRAYVVGDATARAAAALGFEPIGLESGDASTLAARILQLHDPNDDRLLCFVCGHRRRDVLPNQLRAAGLALHEIVAYTTSTTAPQVDPADFDAAVWFSPSAVEAVFSHTEATPDASWNSLRHAAIGPTTAAALDDAGCRVDAVATAPNPVALARALSSLLP